MLCLCTQSESFGSHLFIKMTENVIITCTKRFQIEQACRDSSVHLHANEEGKYSDTAGMVTSNTDESS